MATFDLLIRNGRIFADRRIGEQPASVGVRGERIVALGDVPADAQATTVIDAQGGVVCPGFIDIHTHSDLSAISHPCCASKLHQGVTTEVVGNCSVSAFPINPAYAQEHAHFLQLVGHLRRPLSWTDLNGFGEEVARAAPAINIAPLVGHGALRIAAGMGADTTTAVERRSRLMELLRESFEQGAFGFTTGLSIIPSCLAHHDELTQLIGLSAQYDRMYATHARAGVHVSETESFEEAAAAARATGVRLQYSHLAINQPSHWGQAGKVLEGFHRLRREGVDAAFDVYPYAASSSALSQHLPPWVQEGGLEKMRERLSDTSVRESAVQEMRRSWWGGCEGPWRWERFILSAVPAASELVGRSVAEIADEWRVSGEETALRLCEQYGNAVHIVLHYREERDVMEFMRDDLAIIGSDGLAMPAVDDGSRPHPRSYGCFPRVLGRYVRELSALSLGDAIGKMTAAPADRLGLRDRGRLKEGHFADVLVIDTARIIDRATFDNPFALAEGVNTVIVNGQIAMRDGRSTGVRPGRFLRREH